MKRHSNFPPVRCICAPAKGHAPQQNHQAPRQLLWGCGKVGNLYRPSPVIVMEACTALKKIVIDLINAHDVISVGRPHLEVKRRLFIG